MILNKCVEGVMQNVRAIKLSQVELLNVDAGYSSIHNCKDCVERRDRAGASEGT